MTFKQIMSIVLLIFFLLVIIGACIEAIIIVNQYRKIENLKRDANLTQQTVDKYVKEMKNKDEILAKQNGLIEKIKSIDPNKNWKEYLKIWREINELE